MCAVFWFISCVFDCETERKYWSLNNVGFFDLWEVLRNKKVWGLSEGRDKVKDILTSIMLYFALPNSFSEAGKYFSLVQNKECLKSSDVDFIHLSSGTGCAIMLKISCVSVFESMNSFKRCMMNELHVPSIHWKRNCHFINVLESHNSNTIWMLLFLWTYALVLTLSVWQLLTLKLENKNINAAQNFSWYYTVTAIFSDRVAGRILQVEVQGLLIFDTSWWSLPAPLNLILE